MAYPESKPLDTPINKAEAKNWVDNTNSRLDALKKSAEKSRDLNDVQRRIDVAKDFFSKTIRDMNSDTFLRSQNANSKEIAGLKLTKEAAEAQLKILNNMEKRIHQIMKPGEYKQQENFDHDYDATLQDFNDKLSIIEMSFSQYSSYHNDVITGDADVTPPFDLSKTMNNVAGANRVYEILKKYNRKELQIAGSTLDAANQALVARDLKDFEKYLMKVINDPTFDPSKNHFDSKYQNAINYLASDPKVRKMLEGSDEKPVQPILTPEQKDTLNKVNATLKNGEKTNTYKDRKEAFEKWGINGLTSYGLDQTKMSPEQKETWKWVGNLAVTGGLIFLGWKAISTAFKALSSKGRKDLNENGGRGWLWLPIAGTFGANMLTGESPLALLSGGKGTEYLANLFGGKKSAEAKKYTEWFTGVSSLFEGRTCAQVASTIDTDANGKMKLKPSFFDGVINAAKWNPSDTKKAAAAKFLETVGKDDPGHFIDSALTGMGLSYAALKDNSKEQFNDKAAGAITRLASVTTFMEKNNYDRINKQRLDLISQYIANPNSTMDDLTVLQSRRWDIFENSLTAPSDQVKDNLSKQIKALALSDTEKDELTSTINNFWSFWPLSNDLKKLEIKQDGSNISLTTYDKTTVIDLKNKIIPGFVDASKAPIKFQSNFELIKVANLTNRIFDLVKNNKNTPTKDPFNVSWIGQDIEYDNTKFWSDPVDRFDHMDKTVVSGGFGGALGKISPILEDHKDAYTALLNTRFNKMNNLK